MSLITNVVNKEEFFSEINKAMDKYQNHPFFPEIKKDLDNFMEEEKDVLKVMSFENNFSKRIKEIKICKTDFQKFSFKVYEEIVENYMFKILSEINKDTLDEEVEKGFNILKGFFNVIIKNSNESMLNLIVEKDELLFQVIRVAVQNHYIQSSHDIDSTDFLISECNNIGFIKKLCEKSLENKINNNFNKEALLLEDFVSDLYLISEKELVNFLGRRVKRDIYTRERNVLNSHIAETINKYLDENNKWDFNTYSNSLYINENNGNGFSIKINPVRLNVYAGLKETTFDREFWIRFSGDAFGFGETYIDNNEYVRYVVNSDTEEIKVSFSKNLEDNKKNVYINLMLENLTNLVKEIVDAEIKEPYSKIMRTSNILLKFKLTEEMVLNINKSIRNIGLLEVLPIKSEANQSKRKI